MPASKLAAVCLSLLLAGGLAACGGDEDGGGDAAEGAGGETVSATRYAADVCGAMKEWVTTVQEKSTSMADSFQAGGPEEGKTMLTQLLADMSAATGDLVSAVEDAGIPDVEGGEAVAEDLKDAFTQARQILDDAQDDVRALPNDPAGFQQGAAQLGPTLQEAISGITESLEKPESQELEQAFDEEEACQSAGA